MNISEMKESRFMTKEDAGDGTVVTITGVTRENVAPLTSEPEMKWCLETEELKPLVLNATNTQLLGQILGPETDDWEGQQVEVYNDPSVSYAGKLVGGVRVRKVGGQGQAKHRKVKFGSKDQSTDEVPF